MVKTRGFCFTVNNWTDDDIARLWVNYEMDTSVTYMILGFEEGTRDKTPHIQGYIYYRNPRKWDVVRDDLHPYHVEVQKAKENVKAYCYCMEDGDWYEFGERPRQGHRTDLEVIKHDIHNGRPMSQIRREYFSQWCQYRRAFDEYVKLEDLGVKYDTELIQYQDHDADSFEKMYSEYDPKVDHIITEVITPPQVMHLYFSKQYRKIFIPVFCSSQFMDKYITKLL